MEPLPEGPAPHGLRRTFASILFAIGETPPYVMGQLGTDPGLTLQYYTRKMSRRDGEPERLKTLVEGGVLVGNGESVPVPALTATVRDAGNPVNSGV
jgi:hypothetical protein